jgi:hypothetical protein
MHHEPSTSVAQPANPTVSIAGELTPHHVPACTGQSGKRRLQTGHVTGLASATTTTALCSLLSGGALPDLAGGTIKWSSHSRIADSTGVALSGGSVSVVTIGTDHFLQVTYAAGSVAGGSFVNASGASLTATSRSDITQLTAECAHGPLNTISIRGSMTL